MYLQFSSLAEQPEFAHLYKKRRLDLLQMTSTRSAENLKFYN
jgi:hypothetical protein